MIQSLFSVKDKVVLITGSGRGIGLTIAEGYLPAGAKVVLNNTKIDAMISLVERLRTHGGKAFGYTFDVSNQTEVQRNINLIEQEVGPIDIVFNNAGVHRRAPLEELSLADWRQVLDINLTSAFLVGQAVEKR